MSTGLRRQKVAQCTCGSGLRAVRSYSVTLGAWGVHCDQCRIRTEARDPTTLRRIGDEQDRRDAIARRKLEERRLLLELDIADEHASPRPVLQRNAARPRVVDVPVLLPGAARCGEGA